jgi:Na+-driven multidrug efflux pump
VGNDEIMEYYVWLQLCLGAGNKRRAEKAVGNMICMAVTISIIITLLAALFIKPMLVFFGATKNVMPYALEYVSVSLIGIPFMVIGTCINNTIRADGSPTYSMFSMALGAVINIVLDIIFVFPLNMGMKGAALATILGQIASAIVSALYIPRYKNIKLDKECFKIDGALCKIVTSLGLASGINQLSMFVVQIVLNNSMKYYGARSEYGADIPIASIGIVMKVNMVFMAIVIGISQGTMILKNPTLVWKMSP